MFGIDETLVDGDPAPIVDLELHLVFALHGILLPLEVVGIEAWRDEELREAVQGFREIFGLDVEVVRRPIGIGVGVGVAPVSRHELGESIDLRVFTRGDE